MSKDKHGRLCDVCGHRLPVVRVGRRDRCEAHRAFDPNALIGAASFVPPGWRLTGAQQRAFLLGVTEQYSGQQIKGFIEILKGIQ